MKKKILVGIIVLIMVILVGAIGIERNITQRELEEKEVSAQEIKDTTPPIITLKGSKEITIKDNETYKEPGYTAVDDIDGSIVGKVVISRQNINTEKYKLIYRVSDKSGNTTQVERIINIQKVNQEDKKQTNTTTTSIKNENTNTTTKNNKNQNNTTNKANTNKNKTTNTKTNTINNQEKGIIYLTFDDGPTTSSTPKILDILKKHNIQATFFILNYNSNTEALVKREVAEGHSVGIHGYSHSYKKIYASEETYMENLDKLQAKIYKSTGVKTTITRFPGGSSNTISKFNPGIMTRLSKLVVEKGYTYYDWNIDSGDAGGASSAEAVYKNVTKNLSKSGRNIVLMHDFSGNSKTINALENIIEYGKKNGYTFKKITADTRMLRQ